jgi:hypothetical protein
MKTKLEAGILVQEFIRDVGIPDHIHTDGAKKMTQREWKRTCNEAGNKMTNTEKA